MQYIINQTWYKPKLTLLALLLFPFSCLFGAVVALRRQLYRSHLLNVVSSSTPVIVVGNITVGGTGKTPFVIWLYDWLTQQGFRVAIVSRGVGGRKHRDPHFVQLNDAPDEVGDEAVLIKKKTNATLVIAVNRVRAIQALAEHQLDFIISDDGLQHYRMGRTIEIAMIDGHRRLGNRLLLPAGPLRETASRLKKVNFVVVNDGNNQDVYRMKMINKIEKAIATKKIHAVAAIGNPERFFSSLEQEGFELIKHVFPDHYLYKKSDFDFGDRLPIVITEKDRVKCLNFADERFCCAEVDVKLNAAFESALTNTINQVRG